VQKFITGSCWLGSHVCRWLWAYYSSGAAQRVSGIRSQPVCMAEAPPRYAWHQGAWWWIRRRDATRREDSATRCSHETSKDFIASSMVMTVEDAGTARQDAVTWCWAELRSDEFLGNMAAIYHYCTWWLNGNQNIFTGITVLPYINFLYCLVSELVLKLV
jgi:hypothetical protein